MRILFIDTYNLLHIARWGFGKGNYNIVYNFFRKLKPILEKFNPDKVYFALEGLPKERLELYPEYKANRKGGMTPEAHDDLVRQREIIFDLLRNLPVTIVHHYDYEADDVIYDTIRCFHNHPDHECIVISRDTDFIQLYNQFDNVSIYEPVKKTFLMPTEYDYIAWKSLVGDSSDNIIGIKGVGPKTATKILSNGIEQYLENVPASREIFERNYELIKFADIDIEEGYSAEECEADFDYVFEKFQEFEFVTMTKDSYWEKFKKAF